MILFEAMTWKMAWGNVKKNKRRSFATGLAITAGFVGLNLLGGYLLRVERLLRASTIYLAQSGHVSVYKKDGLENYSAKPTKYLFTGADLKQVEKILTPLMSQVDFLGKYIWTNALLSNGIRSVPVVVSGIDLRAQDRIQTNSFVTTWAKDVIEGSQKELIAKGSQGAISVTKTVAGLADVKKNNDVQLATKNFAGDLNAVNATVVTTHDPGNTFLETTGLLAPLELTQELLGTDGVARLSIFLKDGVSSRSFFKTLKELLPTQFEAYIYDDDKVGPFYVGTMGFLYVMAGFFIFLICGAVALSIVNSLTISILERSREIGILRALGYNALTIVTLFTKEALVLTSLSCVIGTVLAKYIGKTVNRAGFHFHPPGSAQPIPFEVYPELWVSLILAFLFFIITVATSYFVVRSRSSMKITTLFADQGA